MSSSATAPLKHASNTDYNPPVNAFTTVIVVLSTIAISARCYGRYLAKNVTWGADDAFAVLGWFGLFGNGIGNYLIAASNLLSTTPPTAAQALLATQAMSSVGITYTVSVVASKISFLLLLRRIFGMRVVWFKWAWYITFAVLFPIWTTVAFTFAGLSFAKAMSLAVTLKYAIPSVTFINTFSDLLILVLPIGMTRSLQLSWQQRLSVMFMFMLGSAGFVISLLRSIRNLQSQSEKWDSRYQIYSEVMLGVAEAGTILICTCLPVTRPIYIRFKDFTKRTVTNITERSNGSRGHTTKVSLGSQGFHDEYNDEAPMNVKLNVIHRQTKYEVESQPRKEYPSRLTPSAKGGR